MSDRKLDRELLEEMHLALAEELLNKVKSGNASPQELSCARQFLKDNNIEALMTASSPMKSLAHNLPFDEDESVGASHTPH